jgi:hypothetical protein
LKKKEEERKEKQCIPETLQQKRSQAAQWVKLWGRVEKGFLQLLLQDNLMKKDNP